MEFLNIIQVTGDCPKGIFAKFIASVSLSKFYPILGECVRNLNHKLLFDGSFHNSSLLLTALVLGIGYGLNPDPVIFSLTVQEMT